MERQESIATFEDWIVKGFNKKEDAQALVDELSGWVKNRRKLIEEDDGHFDYEAKPAKDPQFPEYTYQEVEYYIEEVEVQ